VGDARQRARHAIRIHYLRHWTLPLLGRKKEGRRKNPKTLAAG
jgi:hypothetical protein